MSLSSYERPRCQGTTLSGQQCRRRGPFCYQHQKSADGAVAIDGESQCGERGVYTASKWASGIVRMNSSPNTSISNPVSCTAHTSHAEAMPLQNNSNSPVGIPADQAVVSYVERKTHDVIRVGHATPISSNGEYSTLPCNANPHNRKISCHSPTSLPRHAHLASHSGEKFGDSKMSSNMGNLNTVVTSAVSAPDGFALHKTQQTTPAPESGSLQCVNVVDTKLVSSTTAPAFRNRASAPLAQSAQYPGGKSLMYMTLLPGIVPPYSNDMILRSDGENCAQSSKPQISIIKVPALPRLMVPKLNINNRRADSIFRYTVGSDQKVDTSQIASASQSSNTLVCSPLESRQFGKVSIPSRITKYGPTIDSTLPGLGETMRAISRWGSHSVNVGIDCEGSASSTNALAAFPFPNLILTEAGSSEVAPSNATRPDVSSDLSLKAQSCDEALSKSAASSPKVYHHSVPYCDENLLPRSVILLKPSSEALDQTQSDITVPTITRDPSTCAASSRQLIDDTHSDELVTERDSNKVEMRQSLNPQTSSLLFRPAQPYTTPSSRLSTPQVSATHLRDAYHEWREAAVRENEAFGQVFSFLFRDVGGEDISNVEVCAGPEGATVIKTIEKRQGRQRKGQSVLRAAMERWQGVEREVTEKKQVFLTSAVDFMEDNELL